MFTRHWQIVARSTRGYRVPPVPSSSGHSHARIPLPSTTQPVLQTGVRTRPFTTTVPVRTTQEESWKASSTPLSSPIAQEDTQNTLQSQEPRLSLTFTCTVPDCGTRSTHEFTKRSYEKGIVIVECPGCHNRHLIADHLGWFKESMDEGKLKTVEDLMRAKGEAVRRGRLHEGDVIEYAPE
ncbi:hypothetical protein NM688_g8670 [Phlebia brevispora]|uniref:Uncharacterized protein n=1 Tax=Phlebia brevispora TaxID=194682 RepID=A0ACC1RRT0_9APHY|nr:hypothetical protein NM688_g8670 [Phlebia brevispora]